MRDLRRQRPPEPDLAHPRATRTRRTECFFAHTEFPGDGKGREGTIGLEDRRTAGGNSGSGNVRALGWSEVRRCVAGRQALPASIYETQGFRTIAETPGCPDAFEHMLSGCHGERTKEVVTAELARTGLSPQAAARCRMMEHDLTVPGRSPA